MLRKRLQTFLFLRIYPLRIALQVPGEVGVLLASSNEVLQITMELLE
jgi:hypothetical protein